MATHTMTPIIKEITKRYRDPVTGYFVVESKEMYATDPLANERDVYETESLSIAIEKPTLRTYVLPFSAKLISWDKDGNEEDDEQMKKRHSILQKAFETCWDALYNEEHMWRNTWLQYVMDGVKDELIEKGIEIKDQIAGDIGCIDVRINEQDGFTLHGKLIWESFDAPLEIVQKYVQQGLAEEMSKNALVSIKERWNFQFYPKTVS